MNNRFVSTAIVRPGYDDDTKRKSEGTNYKRGDSYTKRNIVAVAHVIMELRTRHNPKRIILIGHSGGAAMAAVIIGMYPELVDKAILASCPCNISRWRKLNKRRSWKRSLSPSSYVNNVPTTTEVVAIVGKKDKNTRQSLSTNYIARLKKRKINARAILVNDAGHGFRGLWSDVVAEIVK